VLKGTPTDCYACHQKDDFHKGTFGQDCGTCHSTDAWLPISFDHSTTTFPLTGAHVTLTCETCHINGVFKGTLTACYACHQKDDFHKGAFGQDCSLCHTTTAWLPSTFDHAKTAFPLTGAHINLACQSCHINNVYAGTPTYCSAWHADPAYHLGLFGLNCVTCHTTAAWIPAVFNGPHSFPMNHGGAGGNCRTCHPTTLAAYTCYTCHNQSSIQQRHQGIANLGNCVACHPTGGGGG
jgi:hypothetical protein